MESNKFQLLKVSDLSFDLQSEPLAMASLIKSGISSIKQQGKRRMTHLDSAKFLKAFTGIISGIPV